MFDTGAFIGHVHLFDKEIINEYFQVNHIMDASGDGNGGASGGKGILLEVENGMLHKALHRKSVHNLRKSV